MARSPAKKATRPVGRPKATLSRSRFKWLREYADVPADVTTFKGVVAYLASQGLKDTTIGSLCGVDNETIKRNFTQTLVECRALRALGLRKLTDVRSETETSIHKHRLTHELGESDKVQVENTGPPPAIQVVLPPSASPELVAAMSKWQGGAK